jgi:uncharacterized protein YhjY with autotransporter beta-barrel domain
MAALGWRHAIGTFASLGYAKAAAANALEGTELERGDDVAASLGHRHQIDAWHVTGQVIGILRLDESTVTNGAGGRIAVTDSDGLQLNGRLRAGWEITPASTLELGIAKPFLSRDSDVDGLTRAYGIDVTASLAF